VTPKIAAMDMNRLFKPASPRFGLTHTLLALTPADGDTIKALLDKQFEDRFYKNNPEQRGKVSTQPVWRMGEDYGTVEVKVEVPMGQHTHHQGTDWYVMAKGDTDTMACLAANDLQGRFRNYKINGSLSLNPFTMFTVSPEVLSASVTEGQIVNLDKLLHRERAEASGQSPVGAGFTPAIPVPPIRAFRPVRPRTGAPIDYLDV
jgi:hypothetical protein